MRAQFPPGSASRDLLKIIKYSAWKDDRGEDTIKISSLQNITASVSCGGSGKRPGPVRFSTNISEIHTLVLVVKFASGHFVFCLNSTFALFVWASNQQINPNQSFLDSSDLNIGKSS